jgi:acylphosphatase
MSSKGTDERLDTTIHGRVQGVGFRIFVVREASALGLTGWVANESSGRVRCVAEGPRAGLEQLLAALREGPSGAWVDRVDEAWSEASGGFSRFEVRSGWHSGD